MAGRKPTITNEKHVKREVKKLLDKHKWFWWMPPSNAYGKSGIADFHALKADVFMVIETKFGSNKPTPNQVGFLNSIQAEGAFAFVVNEKNLDQLELFLDLFAKAAATAADKQQIKNEDGAGMLDAMRALTMLIPLTM